MGRRPDVKRRAEVLDALVDYVLDAGIADFSLRPAAAAIGTSDRMLVYHFGSKENLILEVIAAVRERQRAVFRRGIAESQAKGSANQAPNVGPSLWKWYMSRRQEPYLRLFYETLGLAIKSPRRFKAFLEEYRTEFPAMLRGALRVEGFSEQQTELMATIYLAAFRGLQIDLLVSGDHARIDAAVEALSEEILSVVLERRKSGGRRRKRRLLPG